MGLQEKLVWQYKWWDFDVTVLVLFQVLQCRYICELEVRTPGITFLALLFSRGLTLEVLSLHLNFSCVKRRWWQASVTQGQSCSSFHWSSWGLGVKGGFVSLAILCFLWDVKLWWVFIWGGLTLIGDCNFSISPYPFVLKRGFHMFCGTGSCRGVRQTLFVPREKIFWYK